MRRITILEPHIANQIAAGEVVERPASVIKELVENSIDAQASSITIEIINGGLDYIRVSDNGTGIPSKDTKLAFNRHATSKISEQADLVQIATLGFRGEALASIASVSQVELKTYFAGEELGTHLRLEGGEHKLYKSIACPEGTSIEVANLFYNIPARRKFLKSARTEAAYVGDYVARMLLARPEISFKYISNRNLVYHSVGDGILKNAAFSIYGKEILPNILETHFENGYILIYGFIGDEKLSRPNRKDQSFFVNGRYIRSPLLSNALHASYETLLMTGRYPFAVINICISSREVDVNVHPAKLEVRFAQEERVAGAVIEACKNALKNIRIPEVSIKIPNASFENMQNIEPLNNTQEPINSLRIRSEKNEVKAAFMPFGSERPASFKVKESAYEIPHFSISSPTVSKPEAEQSEIFEAECQNTFGEQPLTVLGQAFKSYWIIQKEDSLYFIDQHAMHERKLYEQFIGQNETISKQPLLSPELLQLTSIEYDTLLQHLGTLHALGFDWEPFGETAIRISSVPSVFANAKVGLLLRDILEELRRKGRTTVQEIKREAIIRAACKHAVKAGDLLQKDEIISLLEEYKTGKIPITCPHGRPIIVRLSHHELKKLFKRII